jgi:hypothetical protein
MIWDRLLRSVMLVLSVCGNREDRIEGARIMPSSRQSGQALNERIQAQLRITGWSA